MAGPADDSLPDLSKAPEGAPGDGKTNTEVERLDDMLEDAVEGINVTDEKVAAIIAKAAVYEEKLKKPQHQVTTKGNDEKEETKKEEKGGEKGKEKRKIPVPTQQRGRQTEGARKARAALALMSSATTEPPVKPVPPVTTPPANTSENDAREGGKKEDEGAAGTPPQEARTEEEKGEAEKEDDKLWKEASPITDTFPQVEVPDPSHEYIALSVSSNQWEGLASDIAALTRKSEDIMSMVQGLNRHVATLETRIISIEQDKAKYAAALLDRVRGAEREIGNRPSLATPATAVAPLSASTQPVPSGHGGTTDASKQAKLAAWKASRK